MAQLHDAVIHDILQRRARSSRGCRNKRGVKRKMSSFPIRRKEPTLRLYDDNSSLVEIIK